MEEVQEVFLKLMEFEAEDEKVIIDFLNSKSLKELLECYPVLPITQIAQGKINALHDIIYWEETE